VRFGVLVLLSACGFGSPVTLPERPHVVVVTVDTLRADRLAAYGSRRPTTPALDAFAGKATVWTRAYASAPWTMPSLASLFTATSPLVHGIGRWEQRFDDRLATLAEAFRDGGYETAAVVSHHALLPEFGFDRGFSAYDTSVLDAGSPSTVSTAPDVTEHALALLGAPRERPFFLWVHYFDPHAQYVPHDGYVMGTGDADLYDGEVAWTDAALAPVLDRLLKPDLVDETVVVVTADHGEEFREHHGTGHGTTLYDEVVRVPLLVRVPGFKPRRLDDPVPLASLAPTLLTLAHLPIPWTMNEAPLPLASDRFVETNRTLTLETLQGANLRGVVNGCWKLVEDRRRERTQLFNQCEDPGETHDRATTEVRTAAALRETVDAFYANDPRPPTPRAISPEAGAALEALGYRAE